LRYCVSLILIRVPSGLIERPARRIDPIQILRGNGFAVRLYVSLVGGQIVMSMDEAGRAKIVHYDEFDT